MTTVAVDACREHFGVFILVPVCYLNALDLLTTVPPTVPSPLKPRKTLLQSHHKRCPRTHVVRQMGLGDSPPRRENRGDGCENDTSFAFIYHFRMNILKYVQMFQVLQGRIKRRGNQQQQKVGRVHTECTVHRPQRLPCGMTDVSSPSRLNYLRRCTWHDLGLGTPAAPGRTGGARRPWPWTPAPRCPPHHAGGRAAGLGPGGGNGSSAWPAASPAPAHLSPLGPSPFLPPPPPRLCLCPCL